MRQKFSGRYEKCFEEKLGPQTGNFLLKFAEAPQIEDF